MADSENKESSKDISFEVNKEIDDLKSGDISPFINGDKIRKTQVNEAYSLDIPSIIIDLSNSGVLTESILKSIEIIIHSGKRVLKDKGKLSDGTVERMEYVLNNNIDNDISYDTTVYIRVNGVFKEIGKGNFSLLVRNLPIISKSIKGSKLYYNRDGVLKVYGKYDANIIRLKL